MKRATKFSFVALCIFVLSPGYAAPSMAATEIVLPGFGSEAPVRYFPNSSFFCTTFTLLPSLRVLDTTS